MRGQSSFIFSNSIAPALSSNTVHCTRGRCVDMGKLIAVISFNMRIKGIACRREYDSAVYSASVVLRLISDWSWDFHNRKQPAYDIIYLCGDRAMSESS